ncbi:MAG TPA: hypothetical protein VGQ44_14175 [Gemmatimonadaceae bacterium]|jgi:hypothetical protein|nr:hypothetical protein [Gemmatimonadaceae bacterium]
MTHAMELPTNACPHELRPGTTVCLHCRWEAKSAARKRRRRLLMKGSSGIALLTTLAVIGLVGRVTILQHMSAAGIRVVTSDVGGDAAPPMPVIRHRDPATQQGVNAPSTSAPTPAPVATIALSPVSPVVPQGQSTLPDSLMATRADSVITVSFDRTMIRTRNPWKFERLVRTTLPALYGPAADSALSRIPEGGLARQGDLINELPTRGMRIPVAPGWTFTLFPITRPGHDGPLVTQYRVSVVRG